MYYVHLFILYFKSNVQLVERVNVVYIILMAATSRGLGVSDPLAIVGESVPVMRPDTNFLELMKKSKTKIRQNWPALKCRHILSVMV